MKKYRIAYAGVFDLKNYGDHLFPRIFAKEMGKRGLDFEILLFSNYECIQNFEGNYRVYSLGELEEIHKSAPIDAVVIGGGEIIHPYEFEQTIHVTDTVEQVQYQMLNIWLKPILFCEKNRIPCILNGVGVPYELGDEPVIAKLFDVPSYITVRNQMSKQFLERTGTSAQIHLIPDSAFLISSVYSTEELSDVRKKLDLPSRYVVFQCGKALPKEAKEELKNIFLGLKTEGYEVVFLPLAYTNGDDMFLNKLARELNISIYTFPRELKVLELAAILAGCSRYIGLSFHGAITAASYGVVPVLYDYYNQVKTKDLFDYLKIPELRVVHFEELESACSKQAELEKDILSDVLETIHTQLNNFFDKVYSIITSQAGEGSSVDLQSYKEEYIETIFRNNSLSLRGRELEQERNHIQEVLRKTEQEAGNIQKQLEQAQCLLQERERTVKDYQMELENQKERMKKLQKEMEHVQGERDLLENFHQEVLNSKTFKLLHSFDLKHKNKE